MMKNSRPPGKKGQNLVEYALLLSIVTSIGFLVYSQGLFISSTDTVFNHAASLMENAMGLSSPERPSFPDSIGAAIRSGALSLDKGEYVLSGTAAGDALASRLGIPCGEGDAWSIGRLADESYGKDDYIVVVYSAAANEGTPISRFHTDWEVYGEENKKIARRGPLTVLPVTKYGYTASTGEADHDYARSSHFFGYGKEGRLVVGPDKKNTVL
nr:hypothetical protein [uncultured Dialister sp.]